MYRFLHVLGKSLFRFSLAVAVFDPLGSARASRVETVLYSFRSGHDGANPQAGLLADNVGNLYGTTANGGDPNCNLTGQPGCGTVFKLTTDGTETVLYAFHDGSDGGLPLAGVIADRNGNLYGTTYAGGNLHCTVIGCGTVFKLTGQNVESVLHAFSLTTDGGFVWAGVMRDKSGDLYGTTYNGGNYNCNEFFGCGLVFKLTSDGAETVLHSFSGGSDGSYPQAGFIADSTGNLYGTTENGGGTNCAINGQQGCGTVFKLTAQGGESVLYALKGRKDGSFPLAGVLVDAVGNLYGTASQGGKANAGIVFKVSPQGAESILLPFDGSKGGANPHALLIADKKGNLYGTTLAGGAANAGNVFKLSPLGKETVLHSFGVGRDGANPYSGVIADGVGNLYGTTNAGGAYSYGTIYKIAREMMPQGEKAKRRKHRGS